MKFHFSDSLSVDLDAEPFKSEGLRIGFYSAPGTRKSYTVAACLVEPFLEQGGSVVIFEPRSEWHTLKQRYGNVVVVGGPYQDVPLAVKHAKLYAEAIVTGGASMVFDFSDTEDKDLVAFAAELLARLFTLENVTRRPLLLVVEEASEYCPFNTKGKMVEPWIYDRMTGRLVKIATQGRPLGFLMTIVSQRPAQLNYTVRMMCNLSFYGKFHAKDLNDITEVLEAYKLSRSEVKELAQQCVNMPHGEWLTITGEKVEKLTVQVKRLTPHGADTPNVAIVPPDSEAQGVTKNLASTIQQLIKDEEAEESTVTKLRRELADASGEIDTLKKALEQKETALQVAGAIKITSPEASQKDIEAKARELFLKGMKTAENKLYEVFTELKAFPPTFDWEKMLTQSNNSQATILHSALYETWAPKLPHAAKRVLKLLAVDKRGLHMTKREIGVALGYRTTGGSFTGAISTLKRNHLIKSDGNTLWVE